MKLNWFSPLPPAKTDIAGYATRVLPTLSQSADVVAWTDQSEWDPEVEQYAEVRHYNSTELPWPEVNRADINIYHIGNNPYFHRNIWEISRRCPGLVVLHDLKLHHFFEWIYHRQPNGRATYLNEMARYYGLSGREAGERYWKDELTIEFMADHYPLTALALENALGVVTHSKESYNSLSQIKGLPVTYLPLPYLSKNPIAYPKKSYEPPYRLIVFGYISANRCIEQVLEALSTLPEKDCFYLDIYGEVWDPDYITQKIYSLDLADRVKIHGFVEEYQLDSALANAHLAINLRYPTMGEASGSQLRIWSHKLPSLVTKIGWYAELADDTVCFVEPQQEIRDTQMLLRSFLADPLPFQKTGNNGYALLNNHHQVDLYTGALLSFISQLQARNCSRVAAAMIKSVSKHLIGYEKLENFKDLTSGIAQAIYFFEIN